VTALCFLGFGGRLNCSLFPEEKKVTASTGRLNFIMITIKRQFGSTFSNDSLSTGKI